MTGENGRCEDENTKKDAHHCEEFAFAPAGPWTVRPGIGVGE
jgi:hypothetical protein